MSQTCGCHYAGIHAGKFCQQERRRYFVFRSVTFASLRSFGQTNHSSIRLNTRHHRRHRTRGIRRLRIDVVGFAQASKWHFLKAKLVFLATHSLLLACIDTCSSDSRDPHAVTDKQDDVFGLWHGSQCLRSLIQRRCCIDKPGVTDRYYLLVPVNWGIRRVCVVDTTASHQCGCCSNKNGTYQGLYH